MLVHARYINFKQRLLMWLKYRRITGKFCAYDIDTSKEINREMFALTSLLEADDIINCKNGGVNYKSDSITVDNMLRTKHRVWEKLNLTHRRWKQIEVYEISLQKQFSSYLRGVGLH